MLRLIGILTGSAIAIGFLIVALGLPAFSPPPDAAEEIAEIVLPDIPEPAVYENEPAPGLPDEAPELPVEAPDPEPVVQTEPEMPDDEALIEQIFSAEPATIVEENWYAFWSPFRSELAANGFVSKLQESTGIDYRVVKVKTGVYEVAFAYVDDADIQDKLARISSATGLDMSGS